jgi:hypothetical protein
MLGSYRVYDADAHVILEPAMLEDLPEKYVPRCPRPATFSDSSCLFRAYNRFMGRQCRVNSKRLKWAGLVPLREPRESIAALEEMIDLEVSRAN